MITADSTRDKAMGAYIGGAIGDAIGGPVEGLHAARIRRLCGAITGFLPYAPPHHAKAVPRAGGPLHAEPGSVTDDSFLRAELTRYFLNTEPPRTPKKLAEYFIAHANRDYFWYPKLEPLNRIQKGEVSAEDAGMDAPQGGGAAWWTPIGILHAGDPKGAAKETRNLCRIWKAPLEQDILSCVQAALAEGLKDKANVDSMMKALLSVCGPLAGKLMERGISIGRKARSFDDLLYTLYHTALMPENVMKGDFPESAGMIKDADAPMPPIHPCVEDTDDKYATNALAEQMPFAAAVFVFSKGTPAAITNAAMLGRDADSIATTVGSWVGALRGESGLPKEWVETVCIVNTVEIDIRGLAEGLLRLDG